MPLQRPKIIIRRQTDTINTRAMRYSALMRSSSGQTIFISNSGGNINNTYQEPVRNKF